MRGLTVCVQACMNETQYFDFSKQVYGHILKEGTLSKMHSNFCTEIKQTKEEYTEPQFQAM